MASRMQTRDGSSEVPRKEVALCVSPGFGWEAPFLLLAPELKRVSVLFGPRDSVHPGPGEAALGGPQGAVGEAHCEQGWSLRECLSGPRYVACVRERRGVVHQGTRGVVTTWPGQWV